MNYRIGFGYDVHQLVLGRDFWLGGIKIPFEQGGLGHSDADVLIHVICDALLGAANLGDIGKHFPDNSDEFKDIDSKILLKKSGGKILRDSLRKNFLKFIKVRSRFKTSKCYLVFDGAKLTFLFKILKCINSS